jgi:putative oxidoreductase
MNGQAGSEPKLIFPGLAGFYAATSDLWYPMIRIAIGLILFIHGWGKLTGAGLGGVTGYMGKLGLAPSGGFAFAAIFLETVGALCIAAGLFTRFFAAALAIELGLAFLVVHMSKGFAVGGGGYEYVLLLGVVMFAIALRGGGPYSVDRMIGKEL